MRGLHFVTLVSLLVGGQISAARPVFAEELRATNLRVVGAWHFLNQYRDFEEPFWLQTVP